MTFRKKILLFFFPIATTFILCNGLEWESPDNYLSPAHKLTNLFAIPKEQRPTGKGVRVGIIDSGIDFTHPALGGCFGENCRVQFGKAFFTADEFLPNHLKGTPYDNNGHGTMIAGVIGGNDENILGVAPDVIFGAYKVSNTSVSSILTFMNAVKMAIEDKMNIIVICTDFDENNWHDAIPYFDNTIVILSAGNNGNLNSKTLDQMANRNDVISVASMTSDYYEVNQIEISSKTDSIHVTLTYLFVFPEKPNEITDRTWILLEKVDPSNENGCRVATYPSLEEKVVLVTLDGCPIQTKVENLKHSKVSGVIVYTEVNCDFYFNTTYLPPIPVAGINNFPKELQQILKSSFEIKILTKTLIFYKFHQISNFSSWGPSKNIDLKPDITAPGDYVTTTAPLNRGKYKTVRGTSYSAPYIAGLAALFLEANPNASPKDFSQALMNSATPIRDISGKSAWSVARQGAGVPNGYGLLMNKVKVSPHEISLGTIKKTQSITLTIMNTDERSKVFAISHLPSVLLKQGSMSTAAFLNVSFSPSLEKYRIAPKTFIEIQVTYSTQNEESLSFIEYASGYVYLEEVSDSTRPSSITNDKIHIPYLGELDVNSLIAVDTNVFCLFDYASIYDYINRKFYYESNEIITLSPYFLNYEFTAQFTLPLNQLTLDLMDGSSSMFVKTLKIERKIPSGIKRILLYTFESRIPKEIKSFRFRVTAENANLKDEWLSPLFLNSI